MCNYPGVSLRSLTVLMLCLAFLGARVSGLHFHVSGEHDPAAVMAYDHAEHAHHHGSHLTSEFAVGHFDDHASHQVTDAGSDVGILSKMATNAVLVLLVMFWLAFALASRVSAGLNVPVECFRPPPFRRRPTILPPSQGPPRAA